MEQDGIMYVRLWLFATSIDAGTGIGALAAVVAGRERSRNVRERIRKIPEYTCKYLDIPVSTWIYL